MFDQIFAEALYVVGCVVLLAGILAQFKSLSHGGMMTIFFGYLLMLVAMCRHFMRDRSADKLLGLTSFEQTMFTVAVSVLKTLGCYLCFLAVYSIEILANRALVPVGVAGCFMMAMGGVACFFKELWIARVPRQQP